VWKSCSGWPETIQEPDATARYTAREASGLDRGSPILCRDREEAVLRTRTNSLQHPTFSGQPVC
jgi:hypothetical protein